MPTKLETVTRTGIEILKAGTWKSANAGSVTFTERDLDDMADAYRRTAQEFRTPVKLGHEMRQAVFGDLAGQLGDGEPAFGWIENIRRKGDRLLADFTDLPAKLAQMIEAKAWRHRSPEIHFGYEIGGRKYRRVVTAVSLLGAVPPAIEGMADLYSHEAGGEWYAVVFAGDTVPATELEGILADLRKLRGRWEVLSKSRRGVRRMRSLFDAFEADLSRVARANLAKGDDMTVNELAALLGLDDDAESAEVVVALAKGDKIDEVVKLAEGLEFGNADQFVAWLAGKLDVSPSDLGAIAGAVADAMGLGDAPAEEPTEDEGEVPMSKDKQVPDVAALSKQIDEASAERATLLKQVAGLEHDKAVSVATIAVDSLMTDGKAAPAERDTLVKLALADPVAFAEYAKARPTIVKLAGEKGTSKPETELSAADIEVARDMGTDLDELRKFKAAQ